MKKLAILLLLFTTLGIVQACTITPATTTGTTGTPVSFTLSLAEGEGDPITRTCETGGASTGISAGAFSCTYTTPGTPKTITVTTQSDGGSVTCTATATISEPAGNQAPTVSITSPSGAGIPTVAGSGSVTFTGTASDSDGTISLVEVQIGTEGTGGGCGTGAWQSATGTNTWTFAWSPPPNRLNCVVRARARDNGGVESSVATVTFNTGNPSSGGGGGSTCTTSCSNRQRTTCVAGLPVLGPVDCCTASDCSDTCVSGRYRTATCPAGGGSCTYGTAQYVPGQCGYNPSCQLGMPSQVNRNSPATIYVRYQNFLAAPPGSVSVNCGNGQTSSATCSGTSGNCTTTCTYPTAGAYTPSVTIQGVACSTLSLTVASGSGTGTSGTTNNQGTTTTNGQQTVAGANTVLTCSLNAVTQANAGDRILVRIQYAGVSGIMPNLLNVNCGNGQTATAPGCTANVLGRGECTAICPFDVPGTYTPSMVLQGVACTTAGINVLVASNTGSGIQLPAAEANITVQDFATSPTTILEDAETHLTALVRSDQPLTNAECTPLDNQQSSCSCELSSTTEPNPIVSCEVQPPVSGVYQITFTAQDGKTKTAEVTLTPGESGTIEVVNREGDATTFYAAVAAIVLLLSYAAYFAYTKISEKLTYKDRLYKRRQEILKEIEYTKVGFMKGEIGQPQFQKIYNDKQKELTDTNTKIAEAEKQKK